jgi:hypothetical protein
MSFCTAVNCIDGRTQLPVIEYLTEELGVEYVDMVTEPGPVRATTDRPDRGLSGSILQHAVLSIEEHDSVALAVVAHHGCAGNPVSDDEQIQQLEYAADALAKQFPAIPIHCLWVDGDWSVSEVCSRIPEAE